MKNTKKIVCLYGGPGTGKSTTAADIFVQSKRRDINSELVREYVKNWVWEGRKILLTDQLYILAKQARMEQILLKDLDFIVTDSPMWLSCIYEKKISTAPFVTKSMIEKYVSEAKKNNFEYIHVFLRRVKKYNPKGRFQNEEEAKDIDSEIKSFLKNENIDFIEVDADENAAFKILKKLGL